MIVTFSTFQYVVIWKNIWIETYILKQVFAFYNSVHLSQPIVQTFDDFWSLLNLVLLHPKILPKLKIRSDNMLSAQNIYLRYLGKSSLQGETCVTCVIFLMVCICGSFVSPRPFILLTLVFHVLLKYLKYFHQVSKYFLGGKHNADLLYCNLCNSLLLRSTRFETLVWWRLKDQVPLIYPDIKD